MPELKTIFFTGGSSGIGLELAKRYAQKGWAVGIASVEALADVREQLPEGTHYRQLDVRDAEATSAAIQEFAEAVGGLGILAACAGVNHPKTRIPDAERARFVIDVNVHGTFNAVIPAIDIMRAQGQGQILLFSSISATSGYPGMWAYGASKAAVMNLGEVLDVDLRDEGIAVTTVAPGYIDTPLTQSNPHKMPFLMTAVEAAARIHRALDRRQGWLMFPWQTALVAKLLYLMPRRLYRWVQRRDLFGMRADS